MIVDFPLPEFPRRMISLDFMYVASLFVSSLALILRFFAENHSGPPINRCTNQENGHLPTEVTCIDEAYKSAYQ